MSLYCNIDDLISESDVEQKLIYPFLTGSYPAGCSYEPKDILTKNRIKPHTIGKANRKTYFPDYIVTISGIPVMVVEAKRPDINVYDAYSEARLYANELNSKFVHAVNPCRNIIVSNGSAIIAGYSDYEEPFIKVEFSDIIIGNIDFYKLLDFASKETLLKYSKELLEKAKGKSKFLKPVSAIGGKRAQNREIQGNTFGKTLSLDYSHVLIPESEDDYKVIVKNAYVESRRREQHVEPILKTIRAVKLPSIDETTLISSKEASPLLNGIEDYVQNKKKRNSLILLVGSVGSGKTTFIRYIKNLVIDRIPEISRSIDWVIINMNNAPISRDKIYTWLLKRVIDKIKDEYSECDFGNKDFLSKLYYDTIQKFENGVGSYLNSTDSVYDLELYKVVKEAINDNELTLKSLLSYLSRYKRKDCIIVLDNVDKGMPQDQLLMFQVAEWFRNEFLCLVMLPMRDTTYNMHRNTPPLDTVIKGLVFRIDPPDLLKVLQLRLNYIYRTQKPNKGSKNYMLETGAKVALKNDEQLEYFKLLLMSIRNDSLIKSVFYSITGRDTRSGIELFIDFCKSGHINAREFLMVKATEGEYTIPNHMMMNAILRGNRLYYSDLESRIKNVFASEYADNWVDPFVRVDILRWLDINKNISGPNGIRGFHRGDELINELSMIGHNEDITLRELVFLIKNKLIIAECSNDEFEKSDLIRISQYGVLHIYMLSNITYLAACSEDVYYKNSETTTKISDRITEKIGDGYLSKTTTIYNAEDMLKYLLDYRNKYLSLPNEIMNSCDLDIYDLEKSFKSLEQAKMSSKKILTKEEKKRKYPEDTLVECMILTTMDYGVFVTIDFEEEGFIPKRRLKQMEPDDFETTDILQARIVEYRTDHNRFELELIERIG